MRWFFISATSCVRVTFLFTHVNEWMKNGGKCQLKLMIKLSNVAIGRLPTLSSSLYAIVKAMFIWCMRKINLFLFQMSATHEMMSICKYAHTTTAAWLHRVHKKSIFGLPVCNTHAYICVQQYIPQIQFEIIFAYLEIKRRNLLHYRNDAHNLI
jgi:hypothetical protein